MSTQPRVTAVILHEVDDCDNATISVEIGRGKDSADRVEHLFNLDIRGSSEGRFALADTINALFTLLGLDPRPQIDVAHRLLDQAITRR